jgi:hypothetical protein
LAVRIGTLWDRHELRGSPKDGYRPAPVQDTRQVEQNKRRIALDAKIVGKKLVIEIPLQKPRLSKTGKTRVVATTRGPWESAIEIEGLPLTIVSNAYIAAAPADTANDEPENEPKPKAKARK